MTAPEVLWRIPGTMTLPEQRALQLVVDEVSEEFVPSLTARSGTTQIALKNVTKNEPDCYFDEILMQHNLLVIENDQLLGFLSFRASHCDVRLPKIGICVYISTIAIIPAARGRGFARLLYRELFELPKTLPAWVLLRTWSTNTGHLRLLHSLKFAILLTVPGDRGIGIDTLYLGRRR